MKDQKTAPYVIIIGLNYGSILTMVRDLGSAGFDIKVLRVFKNPPKAINLLGNMDPEARSRYVSDHRTLVLQGDSGRLKAAVLDMIKESDCEGKPLIIPVDDFLVAALDKHYDELSEVCIIPNAGGSLKICELMDKGLQKRLADEAGLLTARSTMIEVRGEEIIIPEDTPFPCFIKPNVSSLGTKLIMKRYDDREELEETLKARVKGELSVLAEEYIDIKCEYSILGATDGEKVIMPGMFRAQLPGHRERKGVAVTGAIQDTSVWKDYLDKAADFVRSTGYVGMFDLDIIEDKAGRVYFAEMNFRAGASVHAFSSEANIPRAFASSLLEGIPMEDLRVKNDVGKVFVSEKALMEEYVRNDIDKETLIKAVKEADVYFIKDKQDPEPWKYFLKYFRKASLWRTPYRIRDKVFNK